MTTAKYWNWQQDHWPKFSWERTEFQTKENVFLQSSGVLVGIEKHLGDDDKLILLIDSLSTEAVSTSEIEGEFINRDSVQSSFRRRFGLETDHRRVKPAEEGIAEMMVDLYQNYSEPLTHQNLFRWHQMLLNARRDLDDVGAYRTHDDPMRVVSGSIDDPKIHFEAPPSHAIPKEMERFVRWFNDTSPGGKSALPPLTRASIVHLYFVCIHPFEDGNGRIGRAITEKALAQSLGKPTLLALSETILKGRNKYYLALEQNNKSLAVDRWVEYFSDTILAAQNRTLRAMEFIIQKTKFFDRYTDKVNKRQTKVLLRVFREGPDGFLGGLNAEKYISITQTSRATATRDLAELVTLEAVTKSGTGKGTRYHLKLD